MNTIIHKLYFSLKGPKNGNFSLHPIFSKIE